MKKANFYQTVKSLNGKDITESDKPLRISKVLGNALSRSPVTESEDAIRKQNLAHAIWNSTGPMQFEDADWKIIVNFVKKSNFMTILAAKLQDIINKAETVDINKTGKNKKGKQNG